MRKSFLHRLKNAAGTSDSGSALVLTVCVLTMLITFLGLAIFLGLQAYVQSELQKVASTAALVGASSLYTSTGSNMPVANPAKAKSSAIATFNAVVANTPALASFNATIVSGPTVVGDTVTLKVQGAFPTQFLEFANINQILMNADAQAQAVKYTPLSPPAGNPMNITLPNQTNASTVNNIAIVDRTGNDILIQQGSQQQGYKVEGCNTAGCYDLGPIAKGVNGGTGGAEVVWGDVLIDLADAGVSKITSIKITDDGVYSTRSGGTTYMQTQPSGMTIQAINVYGYASLCPTTQACGSPPAGFSRFP